jgi:hypothetical protein
MPGTPFGTHPIGVPSAEPLIWPEGLPIPSGVFPTSAKATPSGTSRAPARQRYNRLNSGGVSAQPLWVFNPLAKIGVLCSRRRARSLIVNPVGSICPCRIRLGNQPRLMEESSGRRRRVYPWACVASTKGTWYVIDIRSEIHFQHYPLVCFIIHQETSSYTPTHTHLSLTDLLQWLSIRCLMTVEREAAAPAWSNRDIRRIWIAVTHRHRVGREQVGRA